MAKATQKEYFPEISGFC